MWCRPTSQTRNGELYAKGHSSGSDDDSLSGLLSAKVGSLHVEDALVLVFVTSACLALSAWV